MARAKYEYWLTNDGITLITGWRRSGLKLEQIAHNMGITPSTLSVWQDRYEQIKKALLKGEEVFYYEVESALYKAATGYDVKEVEQIENFDANGELVSKSRRVRTRHIPPQLGAVCFVLKNSRPNSWRDKPEVVATNEVADDGFIDALNGSAGDDWKDDEENAADEELESGDLVDEE